MMALLLLATATTASLPEGPLDFEADQMRMAPHERRVLLDGAVHLRRSDLLVTGDHAVAEYAAASQQTPPPKKHKGTKKSAVDLGGQALQRFTVQGKVHVERGTRTADGAEGVVDVAAQTLVLTGTPEEPPVLRDGAETLSGERVLLRLDSEDIEVVRPRLTLRRSLPAAPETGAAKEQPMRVEAANLKLNRESRLARFTNDVVLRRGDTTVKSPRMDARYDQDGQLTRLELRGGVDLRQGDRRATGESADYDARTRAVVLTGEPKLYDRGDVLSGERIDLSLDSKEVRVERARGRFRPEAHKDELEPRK